MVADQQRDPVRVVWTEVVAKKVVLPGIRSSHLSDRAGQVAGRVSDWQQRPTVEASRREDGSDCAEVCLAVFLHLVAKSHRPVARVSPRTTRVSIAFTRGAFASNCVCCAVVSVGRIS